MRALAAWLRSGDRWIPALFVVGFLVVLAVNATMIWIALGTFSGLATHDYYDRGRAYNRTLAVAQEVAETGWSADIAVEPLAGGGYLVRARLVDRNGAPVRGANVVARFVRPAGGEDDFETVLAPEGDGLWQAEIASAATGLWEVRLMVTRDDRAFAALTRLVLQP